MVIHVNGQKEILDKNFSIQQFLQTKPNLPGHFVIEHNLNILKKDSWESVLLKDGDILEIIAFYSGGSHD